MLIYCTWFDDRHTVQREDCCKDTCFMAMTGEMSAEGSTYFKG